MLTSCVARAILIIKIACFCVLASLMGQDIPGAVCVNRNNNGLVVNKTWPCEDHYKHGLLHAGVIKRDILETLSLHYKCVIFIAIR